MNENAKIYGLTPSTAWFPYLDGEYYSNGQPKESCPPPDFSGDDAVDNCNISVIDYINPPSPFQRKAATVVKLFTGGKQLRCQEILFKLSDSLTECGMEFGVYYFPTNTADIPFPEITLGDLGPLDTAGNLWTWQPSGTSTPISPNGHRAFAAGPQPNDPPYWIPVHQTKFAALSNTNLNRTTIGVGEEVDFSGMPGNTVWSIKSGAGALSKTNGSTTTFTAPPNAGTAIVSASVGNETTPNEVTFTVKEPTSETAITVPPDDPGQIPPTYGAGMNLTMTLNPTDVSFYNVQTTEVAGPPNKVTGVFTNFTISQLYHWPSGIAGVTNNWIHIYPDNHSTDHAAFTVRWDPIYPGGCDYSIPVQWRVSGNTTINPFPSRVQTLAITSANGSVSAIITKLRCSASKAASINNIYN